MPTIRSLAATRSERWLVPLDTAAGRQTPPRESPGRRLRSWLAHSRTRNLLSIPVIYSLCLPLVALDLWVSLYQATCFPLYGIARVRRRDYFVLDRARLPYLNVAEKVHCAYCGYANGVLSFAREIAARTEQYWCPIKHHRLPKAVHERYARFLEYGDGARFESRAQALRNSLLEEARRGPSTR